MHDTQLENTHIKLLRLTCMLNNFITHIEKITEIDMNASHHDNPHVK